MPASLVVFTSDLRVTDNPSLKAAIAANQPLICLYCLNETELLPNRYGMVSLGLNRQYFLYESLIELHNQLDKLGQKLYFCRGNLLPILQNLFHNYGVNKVFYCETPGSYEQNIWLLARQQNRRVEFNSNYGYTLFTEDQIKKLFQFPGSYSKFRNAVENLPIGLSSFTLREFPAPLLVDEEFLSPIPNKEKETQFKGGAIEGLLHLKRYFSDERRLPSFYKDTRNELKGWENSTKFSPWLTHGCISVRQVVEALKAYEQIVDSNKSTEWIYQELLWREYFQWYAYHYSKKLFYFKGINNTKLLTSFYGQAFKQWCQGTTSWPLVNACMHELNDTGYLSNRGRQIVASALVNELKVDWRYGAAYFESKLIDYDVAVNWGNWQYIAGVGADPRGGRHFNIEKQQQQYDPDEEYIDLWKGRESCISLESTDAADWPISHK